MAQFPAGVSAYVTAPTSYSMQYVNGKNTYKEEFVVIQFGSAYVAAAGASLAGAVHSLALAMQAVPLVGQAVGALVELAAGWYASQSLEPDGSVKLELAYHYAGTKAGGADLTAWPLPGVDYRLWQGMVNGLINGIRGAGRPVRQGIETGESEAGESEAPDLSATKGVAVASLGRPAETDDVISLDEIERTARSLPADEVELQVGVLRSQQHQDDTQRQVLTRLAPG